MNRQSTSRIGITGSLHPVLAVERRKDNLPRAGLRGSQRAIPQRSRQSVEKSVNNAKDAFSCLLRMRHLHSQRSRPRNRLQEKSSCDPCADTHLPRLEHDICLAPSRLKLPLRPVRSEWHDLSRPVAYLQKLFRQEASSNFAI
jgi:hypothetical protein